MRDGLLRIAILLALVSLFALQPLPSATAQVEPTVDCTRVSTGAVPLTDLGRGTYQGAEGGLYPDGSNDVPPDHAALGLWHASQIQPLGADGAPDPDGAIVLISIGVSNTRQEFSAFRKLARDSTGPSVLVVNGSQGGEPIESWLNVSDPTWDDIDSKLTQFNVTPSQVQAAWVKLPERVRSLDVIEPFPLDAETYQADLTAVLQNAKDRYPNLRIAYLSSRIYAGYNTSGRPSPEPLAYQHGFGVKWTIEDQIAGNPGLNADPGQGKVEAPWLAWGPYLWADGTTPRSDGLTWECSDLESDGTHPSDRGAERIGTMLLDHFLSDPTAAPWFTGVPASTTQSPTTTAPTTTTATTTTPSSTTTATTVTSTTLIDDAPAAAAPERPVRPDRRSGAPATSDSPPAELLLAGTALALAAVLAVAALIGRTRRRED